jgi:membrane fusion protein
MASLTSSHPAQTRRLEGAIDLSTPPGWQAITALLFGLLLVAGLVIGLGSFTRTQVAPGTITVDHGVARLTTSRAGVITQINVKEGDLVRAGDSLAVVRSEDLSIDGNMVSAQNLAALEQEGQLLDQQASLLSAAHREEQDTVHHQAAALSAELASLEIQISQQLELIRIGRELIKLAKMGGG